MTAMLSSN